MGNAIRQFEVNLPIGYTDESGQVHRKAILRKMCGYDEELLYDDTLSSGHLVTELLSGCLVQLGEVVDVKSSIVSQLFTADRNYLLLELRRITLGDELNTSYHCPHCNSHVAVVENLRDVDVRRLDAEQPLQDITVMLEDGYLDREGNNHTEIIMTLPRGSDEEFVAPLVSAQPLKAQDALLLRCIKKFGNLSKNTLEAYGIKILRDLTMGDRRLLQRAVSEDQPGINLQRVIQCGPCDNAFIDVMDVSNFFVSG